MKLPWFKRTGILFIPASIIGWIILTGALVYSVYTFIDIDSRSHSVSDTLMNFVFQLLIIIAVYSLFAYLTCRKPKLNTQNLHDKTKKY
jgi:membrane protein DedA with SNARE-associated domain